MLQPGKRGLFIRIGYPQRDKERQQDTRDGGVHPGLKHEKPQHAPRQQIGKQPGNPGTVHDKQQSNRDRRTGQHQKRNITGIEERNNSHCAHVVQNSQRRQENFQRGRYATAQQCQYPERKGNVRGGRNCPASEGFIAARIKPYVNGRRHGHPAQRGKSRQRALAPGGKLTGEKLALDFQADHHEEHGHQGVVYPVLNGEAGGVVFQEYLISLPERRVSHDDSGC
ncbi:Uncharacterised protein [Klebsiella pneumoniae]|nr:Uncharacterised protein [Klebsiella pneumoniae]VGF93200.1 Uncharacterised protein [Klebsiella pneumoniae]